jgi:ParB family chromosome partitioning protein
LRLNMAQWWQPTAQSYLRHVPKAHILDTVREAVTKEAAENLVNLKKDALAAEAEHRLADSGWLPEMPRVPVLPAAMPETIAAE